MEKALGHYISQYADLTNEELELIRPYIQVREFAKRQLITQVGEQEEYLNLVVRGVLRKYFYKGREEVITQLAKEGDLICSSVSYFSGQPSQYVIEALEPVTLYSLSRQHLEELYVVMPRMERLARLVITDLYLCKEKWEQDHIQFDIRQRFVDFVHNNADLIQRVPQKYIASYLNIKPETFSRLKHLLKKAPLLATLS
jgi:CRP-like cAMP-binding protein